MRIQKLPGYNHLILRASGQYSPDRLFLAEKFNLGGEGTIRGINPATLSGDSGLLTSAEFVTSPLFGNRTIFNQKVGDTLKFAFFTDYGKVVTTDRQATDLPDSDRWSVGAGARLYAGKHFTCKLDWAAPWRDGSFSAKHSFTYIQATISF
jgi:hemolysin activation/secretion protein